MTYNDVPASEQQEVVEWGKQKAAKVVFDSKIINKKQDTFFQVVPSYIFTIFIAL